jgi:hypothetical protein
MDGNSTHDDDEVAVEHWDDDGGNEAIAPLSRRYRGRDRRVSRALSPSLTTVLSS